MALPIIDTHQHLWDLTKFTLPWHQAEDVAPLRRSFVMADYLEATRGFNVAKTIYMEVDVAHEQQVAEAEYVFDLCARDDNPMAGAVVSGRPASTEFEPYLRKLAKNRHLKGVRQVLHGGSTPAGYCLQPQFVKSLQLLGDLGLSFDFCMRPGELHDAVAVVDKCPHTRFIVDHCGNMSVASTDAELRAKWQSGMKELAARPNTICKISGIVVTAQEGWTAADLAPNINFSLDTFGENRVMFAGDWPVCTLRATFAHWVAALQTIVKDRSPELQRKLFHDNAARVYALGD
jgi:predicted TIM-barrel fold metal-dependent hydrolase